MSAIVPSSKPQQNLLATLTALKSLGANTDRACLLGVRGYYLNSMGEPGVNDRKIYDDAIILYSPTVHASFNANTDPGAFAKHIANLCPGKWLYKIGIHGLNKPVEKQYKALVQAAKVTVKRDGEGLETGYFGINIHRGGVTKVSSIGCQTIYPSQWPAFIAMVESEMKRYNQRFIDYVLTERS